MKRPSVAMWSHSKNEWYIENCKGEIFWFKTSSEADYISSL